MRRGDQGPSGHRGPRSARARRARGGIHDGPPRATARVRRTGASAVPRDGVVPRRRSGGSGRLGRGARVRRRRRDRDRGRNLPRRPVALRPHELAPDRLSVGPRPQLRRGARCDGRGGRVARVRRGSAAVHPDRRPPRERWHQGGVGRDRRVERRGPRGRHLRGTGSARAAHLFRRGRRATPSARPRTTPSVSC